MDKAVASQVVNTIMELERKLTVLDGLSDKIADDQERRDFRKGLADIIVSYTDILMSVIFQYPELDPDRPSSVPEGDGT